MIFNLKNLIFANALCFTAQHLYQKREGYVSVALTNGFGSGGPKKHVDPADCDPDPQHCLSQNKIHFLSLIRHIFLKTGWSEALPYIFGQVRARDPTCKASIALYGSQLTKLPARV
jgi:hypothetical protein